MSKELEALKRIRKLLEDKYGLLIYIDDLDLIETALKEYETIKDVRITARFDLKQVSKEHRAFEIIKKKEVDAHNFKEILIKQNWTYEQYLDEENDINTSGHQFAYKLLTQEEFDIVKEVLL